MVSSTLERLWMFSDRIVDFRFFDIIISQFRTCNNFQVLNSHGACYLSTPNQAKIYQDLMKMVSSTLEGLWMVSDRIVDFQFFVKFHRSLPAIIFRFWTITSMLVMDQKSSFNQAKNCHDLIKMVSITLEGLWMAPDRIVNFWFFVKFHRSWPAFI